MTDARAIATLHKVVESLDDSQWLSAEDLADHQFRTLVGLASELEDLNPSFATRLADEGLAAADLGTPEGLRSLPVLTRRQLQAAGTSLFSTHLPDAHLPANETRSSGSTGEPVIVQRTSPNQVMWAALTIRDYSWRNLDFRGRFASVRAHFDTIAEQSSWGVPMDWFHNTGPSLLLPIATPIAELAARLEQFRPTLLLVYPTVLEGLVDHWRGAAANP